MVSSIVAVNYWPGRPKPVVHLKETDWTDPDWKKLTWAYAIAKTRAEKAAWEFARKLEAESKLVSVNPGMVWGPLLDSVECTSSDMCKAFLEYPFVPRISYPIVDVRDIGALLVAAMRAPDVGGRRLLAAADTIDLVDIGRHLATSFPQFAWRIPTGTSPDWFTWLLSFLDPKMKQFFPDLETRPEMDSTYVTQLTGVKFRSSREAIYAMAESLVKQNLV